MPNFFSGLATPLVWIVAKCKCCVLKTFDYYIYWTLIEIFYSQQTTVTWAVLDYQRCLRSRRGVGDKPMSCKPGVAGSIPGFSQSVG